MIPAAPATHMADSTVVSSERVTTWQPPARASSPTVPDTAPASVREPLRPASQIQTARTQQAVTAVSATPLTHTRSTVLSTPAGTTDPATAPTASTGS